jgi:AraC-like DNA-binding protein
MDSRIFQLCVQISENPAYNWTIGTMAEATQMSESHFQKLFKAATGTTPLAFVREKRLEKARELLEANHEQICEIGRKVGMPHDSHFTRDFKERYGKTPTAYRREYHDNKQAKILSGQK